MQRINPPIRSIYQSSSQGPPLSPMNPTIVPPTHTTPVTPRLFHPETHASIAVSGNSAPHRRYRRCSGRCPSILNLATGADPEPTAGTGARVTGAEWISGIISRCWTCCIVAFDSTSRQIFLCSYSSRTQTRYTRDPQSGLYKYASP